MRRKLTLHVLLPLIIAAISLPADAGDWPQWGGTDGRNMVCPDAAGLPESFNPGVKKLDGSGIDMSTTVNVKWVARLGTYTFGNPTVSGGKVFIGTNNGAPRNPAYRDDRGVVMCFEEAGGRFLWQLVVSKYPPFGRFNGDNRLLGICSSPTVEGDRVYVVTNRCEVLGLYANGMAEGNRGPFVDEAEYVSHAVRIKPDKGSKQPVADRRASASGGLPALGPTDADIIWRYDMIRELGVWPQDASDCSVLIIGDLLYVCTSNGVDVSHSNIPSPQAPSLIVLDKRTGRLVAVDDADVGPRIYHGLWSSPSAGVVNGRQLVFWGGGDGFCYAFDAAIVPGEAGQVGTLKTIWKFDCNPPDRKIKNGRPLRYMHPEGPSEIIGTPVFVDGRVYVTTGQDPRHGHGLATLSCIDAGAGVGDITTTGKVWQYEDMQRSFATPAVAGGLVYVSDLKGTLHCVDAATGQRVWIHETGGASWASAFVADGKVYLGNEEGILTVLAAGREKKVLSQIKLGTPISCTPIVANDVLYVACRTYLYAVQTPK